MKLDHTYTVANHLTQEVTCLPRVKHGIRVLEEHDEFMTSLAASVQLRKMGQDMKKVLDKHKCPSLLS